MFARSWAVVATTMMIRLQPKRKLECRQKKLQDWLLRKRRLERRLLIKRRAPMLMRRRKSKKN